MLDKDDFLQPYQLPTVSLIRSIASEMVRYELSAEELIALCDKHYDRIMQESTSPVARTQPEKRKCPDCGRMMNLYNKGGMSLYICTNGVKGKRHIGCQHSEVK